jgi:hypothetical protein
MDFSRSRPYNILRANLLSRYEALYGVAGPEAEMERWRIEILFAWKLIHEVAHLGFRWKHGADAKTPANYGEDSREYVERAAFGGITGLMFEKVKGATRWNRSRKVAGLIVCVGCKSFQVDEAHIRLVAAESQRARPVFDDLLPVQLLEVPCLKKRSHTCMSSPRRNSRGGVSVCHGQERTRAGSCAWESAAKGTGTACRRKI